MDVLAILVNAVSKKLDALQVSAEQYGNLKTVYASPALPSPALSGYRTPEWVLLL
jgi:hypothetical protein